MKAPSPKPQRCAIYTRKSTEHNLDLAFNSLDAQREACEAYVKSQAHEGWRLVPDRFDDGGLSGASLERPALQSLLDLVREWRVDVIVVYKVDRLTRSLADFAKLVEAFDEHNVSFVSVTQSFNTTTSMGRLTLNVLLSFAQFEREVIGERVRDKIAASKRKGLWMGGNAPLGYRSENKKIIVVPEDAEVARKIFADYLRIGSLGRLAASLAKEGVTPKRRELSSGRIVETDRFSVGALAQMLKNRFYVGEIVYRGEAFPAEHEGIIDKELFEAVQEKLAEGAIARQKARAKSSAILSGLLFDDRGHAMSPSYAVKKGVRYRYYVSQAMLQGDKANAGSLPRVSAPEVEERVCAALRRALRLKDDAVIMDKAFIAAHVARVMIGADRIDAEFFEALDGAAEGSSRTGDNDADSDEIEPGGLVERPTTKIGIPFAPTKNPRKGVVYAPGGEAKHLGAEASEQLLASVARSRRWMEAILAGRIASFEEIAAAENLNESYVRRLAVLAFLSPKILRAIVSGVAPASCTVSALTLSLPFAWDAQERKFEIA
ncbi:recombinase family protein [Methylosinus sp. KRF6]|uniref:recombinase family protein n=1 Tax=Methylosinus sp. KRF6 TaxID=2846853 RepID=UPI001C0E8D5D|nr:recombinase family protein [Methylosinus sp. KRF6]MBU3888575.1 recombinase family protein [Methylosinus sp. KRF6]